MLVLAAQFTSVSEIGLINVRLSMSYTCKGGNSSGVYTVVSGAHLTPTETVFMNKYLALMICMRGRSDIGLWTLLKCLVKRERRSIVVVFFLSVVKM